MVLDYLLSLILFHLASCEQMTQLLSSFPLLQSDGTRSDFRRRPVIRRIENDIFSHIEYDITAHINWDKGQGGNWQAIDRQPVRRTWGLGPPTSCMCSVPGLTTSSTYLVKALSKRSFLFITFGQFLMN